MLEWNPEFILFLLVGLAILVYEAHRQFNKPAYSTKEESSNRTLLQSLNPSDIRSDYAYMSAELIYLAAIITIYLLFTFSGTVNNVLQFIVGYVAGPAGGGQGLPPAPGGSASAPSAGNAVTTGTDMQRAAIPFVTSVTLVTALRFPLVRKIEEFIRSTAQQLFGIPHIPHERRSKIEQAEIDIEAVEREIAPTSPNLVYTERIESYLSASQGFISSTADMRSFKRNLSKLVAYQLWVGDLGIWPTDEFRVRFDQFSTLHKGLLSRVDGLFQDCEFLLASEQSMDASKALTPKMHEELWSAKAQQAADLAAHAVDLMTLFEQKSSMPRPNLKGATGVRDFLTSVRAGDNVRKVQINLALILVVGCVLASAAHGYMYVKMAIEILLESGVSHQKIDASPSLNAISRAGHYAVTAVLIYGLSIFFALGYRRKQIQSGKWDYFFDEDHPVPPMAQYLGVFVATFLLVFVILFLYLTASLPNWSLFGERSDTWQNTFNLQGFESFTQAIVSAFHASFICLMMDLAREEKQSRKWLSVAMVYILLMVVIGAIIGQLQYLEIGGTPPNPAIVTLKTKLLAVSHGGIALVTSFCLFNLVRPNAAPNAVYAL